MNLKLRELNRAIASVLAIGSAAAVAMPAFAQDDAEKETRIDTVVVTGSRVKRVDAETSQPVFTMSREDIKAQGLTSIGDVIQNITANGSTLNSTYNNGGNGETRVSLRNLGSQRTLVLINGRRWVGGTGLGGAVDLNTIPTSAVERIEVLKDGASAIYGSDAIAGVVNVILRTDFVGAEINTYQGQFDEGDGERQSYDVTIGASGDRFSALFGAAYVQEDPVGAGDREISAEPIIGTGTSFGSTTTPFGRFSVCNTATPVSTPLACPGANRVQPNGAAGQFTYNPGASGTNYRTFLIPDDVYNFAPDNYLLTPQERTSIFGQARVELTDNVSFTMMASYNERKSEQLLAAMPIVLGTTATGLSRDVLIHQNNLYNPFGQPVVRIQRRAVETGGRSFNQNVDTFAFNGTLEGSFSLGEHLFSWDAGYIYAKNDQNDVTNGLFNVAALRQALGPSMLINGVPSCVSTPGSAATRIPDCVPMNLLGAPGSITQDMLAFSSFVAHDQYGYEMLDYFANMYGDMFELPGGFASFAVGVEHRSEEGFDSPDALIASGNTTGNARKPTEGRYTLDEAYVEFALPVLTDVDFAKVLEFSLASRYSDYSNFGDTTNSSFGLKWKPIDDLLIRGSYAEGFRAPSIAELFQGVSDNFPQVADPCNTARFGSLSADAQARCLSQGVPNGGYQQANPQLATLTGGNPTLLPETSVSKTLGIVYSPSYIDGFDVSVDWWQIALEDTISGAGAQFILDDCIINNNQNFCSQYGRLPGGEIDTLLEGLGNIGVQEVEGVDVAFNYSLPDTQFGSFTFSLDNSYTIRNESDNDLDGQLDDSVVGDYQDRNNNWRIRSNLATRWTMGNWGATWNTRFYSHQDEDCQFMVDYGFGDLCSDPDRVDADGNPAAENSLGGTTYHDISGYWNAPWNAKVTLGINNVGDKNPPVSFGTFANSFDPQYEVPGRYYYMQYSQSF